MQHVVSAVEAQGCAVLGVEALTTHMSEQKLLGVGSHACPKASLLRGKFVRAVSRACAGFECRRLSLHLMWTPAVPSKQLSCCLPCMLGVQETYWAVKLLATMAMLAMPTVEDVQLCLAGSRACAMEKPLQMALRDASALVSEIQQQPGRIPAARVHWGPHAATWSAEQVRASGAWGAWGRTT